jgi:glycosyltransferase involved in cell wall biosynthesis
MFISTIIPTIGRQTLARAVYSVLEQGFQHEECEVIVVNDSGKALPIEDWQKLPNVQILSTNRMNRSVARNTGAAVASGRYLHFLDDDDWMLPGAFDAFWKQTKVCSAAWFHGAFRMVNNAGDKIVDVFPEETGNCFINLISWEWLPLQASIVRADAFSKVGGFAMLDDLKGGFEDIHLTRQIAHQYDFMNIPDLIACVRSGDSASTTNYTDMFIQNAESREKSLQLPGSYQRLISSARSNREHRGYWHGRVVYYLLGSARKNFRARRFPAAAMRVLYALAGFFAAGNHLFKADFWDGLMKKFHYPRAWLAVQASEKELYSNTQWNWHS